jgi:hypothetical protein
VYVCGRRFVGIIIVMRWWSEKRGMAVAVVVVVWVVGSSWDYLEIIMEES